MSTLAIFKSHIPSCNYVFKNGKPAIFISGRFTTDVPWEIEELTKEIELGHPILYIDPLEKEMDSRHLDPMAMLRDKFFAEFQALAAAATNPENDMGSSDQSAVKPSSTIDIAAAAAGGAGTSIAARLVNLGK